MESIVRCEKIGSLGSGSDVVPGRSGHRIVCVADEIYVIGGYVQLPTGLKVLGEVWIYNLLAKRWRRLNLPNFPFQLALSASVLVVGKHILIHGGTGFPFAEAINNTIIQIDVATGQCKEHECIPKDGENKNLPEATYGHSLTYVNLPKDNPEGHDPSSLGRAMLIKVGGARGVPYSNVVSAFSFSTGTWEKLFGDDGMESMATFSPRFAVILSLF